MGRPLGTENKDKPYREALRMELATAGPDLQKLRSIARKHIALADRGDMAAIREIADRLDGRPAQEDHWLRRLLRPRGERPCSYRAAAKQDYEFAPSYA
jgi:hypothetical protein